MVQRPTANTPRFSTSGTNIEPPAGKKAAGWTVNERPPAQWMSWLQWSAGEWLDYVAQVLAGVAVTDLQINSANPSATVPTIDVTTSADTASTTYKLLFRFSLGTTRTAAVYVGSSGSTRRFVITQNAVWNGTAWACNDASGPAAAIALRGGTVADVFELLWHAATASTWADSAWSSGGFTTLNAATLHITGTSVFDGAVDINAALTPNSIDTPSLHASASTLDAITAGPTTITAPHLYLKSNVDIVHSTIGDTQPVRIVQIPLCAGKLHNAGTWASIYDPVADYIHSTPGDSLIIDYALEIPRETVQWNVFAVWMAPDSGHANSFSVLKSNRDVTLAVSTPPILATMGTRTQNLFSTSNAHSMQLISPITETVEPYNNSYILRVFIPGNTGGTNRLYAVAVQYSDPGPRNG